jgi:B12-binding domain/radical SAM domain protein
LSNSYIYVIIVTKGAMPATDLLLLHAPSVYDFRTKAVMWGPVSDVIPSTPVFEMYPIGFLTIAEYLGRRGYDVRILNAALKMLRSRRYDVRRSLGGIDAPVVGIDLHWLVHAQGALELARLVKEANYRARVVLGGISASYFHEALLRDHPQVDFVLRGDSTEVPFLQLLEALGKGTPLDNVENLSWRDGRKVRVNPLSHVPDNLDHISLDYRVIVKNAVRHRDIDGHLPYLGYRDHPLTMALPFRGCVHCCLACGGSGRCYRDFMGRKYLGLRSPAKVAQEIAAANELVRSPVFLVHDPRMAGPKYADVLLREIKATGADAEMVFEYFTPPPEDYIRTLARAAPRFNIQISPESHDDAVRRAQGRAYTTKALEKCLTATVEAGCGKLDVFFMIGLSGQTRESVRGTVRYCGGLMERFPGGIGTGLTTFISPLAPFIDPGSAAFEEPEKHGYRRLLSTLEEHRQALLSPTWKGALNYETEWMTRDDIAEASYEAGAELNRLKLRHGRVDGRAAAEVERTNALAREVMKRLEAGQEGGPAGKWGGELCWKDELYWPARGAKLNYRRILRLLLTGR